MSKGILKRLGTILLAVIVTMTMVPLMSQTSEAVAATYPSNPRVTSEKTTWDCVYFGNYPQTEIVGRASQCGTYGNEYWGKSSDYKVDSTLYSQLQNARFNSNGDTTINGTKYHRIKKGDATYGSGGGSLSRYNWDDTPIYHYFRYDKIKWRVLNVNRDNAFLLADKGLDDRSYNEEYEDITWEKCTMRSWLNGYSSSYNTYGKNYSSDNFMDAAFSSSEQGAIYSTRLENSDNIFYGAEGGNSTTDKVFLLSESDVWNTDRAVSYGFVKPYDKHAKQRRAKSSTYAKAMGTDTSTEYAGNCWWWLRSPGAERNGATIVYYNGYVDMVGPNVTMAFNAVRPALHLNLKSKVWSYAGTVSSDGTVAIKSGDVKLGYSNTTFSGEKKTPSVSVKSNGKKLIKDRDYSVSYTSGRKNVGTYKVTVKGKGNYSGTVTKTFKINPKGTTIKTPKATKKAFTAKWSKQSAKMSKSRITGYQVRYSLKKNFSSGVKTKTVKGYKKTSVKISKLKSKKTYYVQVRTYMKVDGKTYYSPWSKTKSVKTK